MKARLVLVSVFVTLSACAPERPPSVFLVSLDTVRADHLSLYGYGRRTTPRLEVLARESLVFDRAFTPVPWTVPAHMSVFTSLYPTVHSIDHLTPQSDLPGTLPEFLKGADYTTAAFVAPVLSRDYGFDRGFDHYFRARRARPAEIMVDRTLAWLADDPQAPNLREQPVFVFLHLFDAHHPYEPPWPFDTAFIRSYRDDIHQLSKSHPYDQDKRLGPRELEEIIGLYDGEIAYTDYALGRFFDALEELGLYESSLIVIFSDHGEGFLEHGLMNHGNSVYEELIRVPLLVKLPGGRRGGTRVAGPVELIDITPTILRELGLSAPAFAQGRFLFEPPVDETGPRAAYASEAYAACLRSRSWKLIENPPSRSQKIPRALDADIELYDLDEDPGEQNNLASASPERVESMRRALRARDDRNRRLRSKIRTRLDAHPLDLTEEQRNELRTLGYVQ